MAMVTLRQAETLVGIPYVEGSFDCVHLVALTHQQLFGRTVPIPQLHPRGRRGQAAVIARLTSAVVERVAEPATGDVGLYIETEDDGGERFHVGTVFLQAGERWLLHAHATSGFSVLQREGDALRMGLRLDGYYRWTDVQPHESI